MPKNKIAGIIVLRNLSMFLKPIHCMGEMTNLCRNLVWGPYKNNPTVFRGIWPSPICLFVCLYQGETRLDKSQAPFHWSQDYSKERVGEGQGQWL